MYWFHTENWRNAGTWFRIKRRGASCRSTMIAFLLISVSASLTESNIWVFLLVGTGISFEGFFLRKEREVLFHECHSFLHLIVLIVCYMTGKNPSSVIRQMWHWRDITQWHEILLYSWMLCMLCPIIRWNPYQICAWCVWPLCCDCKMPEPLHPSTAEMVKTFVHRLQLIDTLSWKTSKYNNMTLSEFLLRCGLGVMRLRQTPITRDLNIYNGWNKLWETTGDMRSVPDICSRNLQKITQHFLFTLCN